MCPSDVAKTVALIAYMLLERWLGRTEKVKAASVIDLAVSALLLIVRKIKPSKEDKK